MCAWWCGKSVVNYHEEVREKEGSFRKGCRPEYRRFLGSSWENTNAQDRLTRGFVSVCSGIEAWFRR